MLDLPNVSLLRRLLRYDADTGSLFWRNRPTDLVESMGGTNNSGSIRGWNTKYAGRAAGAKDNKGYVVIEVCGRKYKAHRVVWAIYHGKWPTSQIDHISGDTSDNRIANLREATGQDNSLNRSIPKTNKSGVAGVTWNGSRGKWQAEIGVRGRKVYLGLFDDLSEAASVRQRAEREYGFHPNHGRAA